MIYRVGINETGQSYIRAIELLGPDRYFYFRSVAELRGLIQALGEALLVLEGESCREWEVKEAP